MRRGGGARGSSSGSARFQTATLVFASSLAVSCGGASRTAATFRESEFVGLNGHGNAAIVGAVSMKIRGMEARLRGGTQIFLVPVTSYTTALQERIIQRGDLGEVDPRLARYRRIAFANEDGQFSFHHLRAGDYY
ncbi:MAG: hypothetical protein M3Z64_02500, partial [Verrucomicrobiota bacterium]|nr:hypothetical protein [Verrucomicrobiota bacterium]